MTIEKDQDQDQTGLHGRITRMICVVNNPNLMERAPVAPIKKANLGLLIRVWMNRKPVIIGQTTCNSI
jgi:hypothetical protein